MYTKLNESKRKRNEKAEEPAVGTIVKAELDKQLALNSGLRELNWKFPSGDGRPTVPGIVPRDHFAEQVRHLRNIQRKLSVHPVAEAVNLLNDEIWKLEEELKRFRLD